MRLRHIEVFHAIMQAGSISGAAQLLHISQPAVTKVLQHAELQLGMALFDRVRGKLFPTPEARRLYVEIDKLNRDLVAIRRLAVTLRAGEQEVLRVMATPALGASLLPGAMTLWAKAFPDSRCTLSTNHTKEIVSALLLGEADLALSLQDPHHPGITAEELASAPMMALCPLKGVEARLDGPLPVADIKSELIAMVEQDPLGAQVMAAFGAQGMQPTSRITVQTYQLARSLVEAGLGLSVVDPFTATMADRKLVRVRPLKPSIPVHLYLLTATKAPLPQVGRKLVKMLGDTTKLALASISA